MESLLTPEEQNLARRLLQPERVQKGILWLLRMALDQPEDKGRKQLRFSRVFSRFVGQSLPRLLKVLARREDFTSSD